MVRHVGFLGGRVFRAFLELLTFVGSQAPLPRDRLAAQVTEVEFPPSHCVAVLHNGSALLTQEVLLSVQEVEPQEEVQRYVGLFAVDSLLGSRVELLHDIEDGGAALLSNLEKVVPHRLTPALTQPV